MKPLLACLLLLTACNREERPEAPTPEEAERLNEAEAMLNAMENEDESTRGSAGQPVNK